VLGFNLGHLWDRQDLLSQALAEILQKVAAGTFRPLVDRTFPLEQAAEAHAYIHAHKNFGKVVLIP
jgi:NADPH:quinone reductase-like Zn-dependent oxidoreductase